MNDSIQSIASSAAGLTDQYRTITQNLVNSNTAGYKRRINTFSQSLATQMSKNADAFQGGAIQANVNVDFSQGPLKSTGQPLDLALNGTGMFVVETPQGELYTRNGSFRVNNQGQLVDHLGRLVSGDSGPIVIPGSVSTMSVTVSPDGQVYAAGQSVGKVKVVEFKNPALMTEVGDNYFKAGGGDAPAQAQNTQVQQGYQENSNVNTVEELVGLITVSRLYEANLKNVQAQDERMKTLLGTAAR